VRVVLGGDILLSRQVAREIEFRGGEDPWAGLGAFLKGADVVGNLEGAVGSKRECLPEAEPCFPIQPAHLRLLKSAPFTAVSLENNHSADLGPGARGRTQELLREAGIEPLSLEDSPTFIRRGDVTLAIVPFSAEGLRGDPYALLRHTLRQRLRLARGLADWVIAYVHWGNELQDWPGPKEQELAAWLVANGADLVAGHHPHVAIEPGCVASRPVFYSLGNLLFDQKYPQTRAGLLADCSFTAASFSCRAARTAARTGSFYPVLAEKDRQTESLSSCRPERPSKSESGQQLQVAIPAGVHSAGRAMEFEMHSPGKRPISITANAPLRALEWGKFAQNGETSLFALEERYSDIDGAVAPRPYVYKIADRGLRALWRGSALAWPLLDATLLCGKECRLCALHRGDSFAVPRADARPLRSMAYRWDGFGFAAADDKPLSEECRRYFELEP